MKPNTITRYELIEAITGETSLQRKQSVCILETIFDAIVEGIREDGATKISAFGSFVIYNKLKRKGRNPKTGKLLHINGYKSVKFKPSLFLKTLVEEGPQ